MAEAIKTLKKKIISLLPSLVFSLSPARARERESSFLFLFPRHDISLLKKKNRPFRCNIFHTLFKYSVSLEGRERGKKKGKKEKRNKKIEKKKGKKENKKKKKRKENGKKEKCSSEISPIKRVLHNATRRENFNFGKRISDPRRRGIRHSKCTFNLKLLMHRFG